MRREGESKYGKSKIDREGRLTRKKRKKERKGKNLVEGEEEVQAVDDQFFKNKLRGGWK